MEEELQSKVHIPLQPLAPKLGSASSEETMRHEPSLASLAVPEEKRAELSSQSATELVPQKAEPPVAAAVPSPPPNGGIIAVRTTFSFVSIHPRPMFCP
jgi:hypothetical protein